MSYSFGNIKWGQDDLGTGSGEITWTMSLVGLSYDSQRYPDLTLADFEAAIRAAFDAWENVANIDFVEVPNPDGTLGDADVDMDIDFSSLSGNTVGYAVTSFRGGSNDGDNIDIITDVSIDFDTGTTWLPNAGAGGTSLFAVAVHEIGHGLGLNHVDDPSEILNPFVSTDELGDGDIAGAQYIYGLKVEPDRTQFGGSGNDVLNGTQDVDTIYGGDGNDTLDGGAGNDLLFGDAGNDMFIVSANDGIDENDGGTGSDTIKSDASFAYANGTVLDLEAETLTIGGLVESWMNFENFDNSNGSSNSHEDVLGTSSANVITTGAGDNEISGRGGADIISSGAGNDRVFAGSGADRVNLGSGNDYVRVGGGVETYDGGSGKDYISYYDSANGITANLGENTISGSWAVNDTIKDFESISGSKTGGDTITGTSGSNTIKTYGGDDRVYSLSGTDKVELGSGDDYVRVGGGTETFDGGSGNDYISYYDSANGIRIDLRDDDVSGSWAVNDTIKDFESASGSGTGDDIMLGTSGANTLRGYGGDDILYGRGGADKLSGGDGEDFLDGGGGSGTDLLYGGKDADVFHFDRGEGVDIIKDFENNLDKIELDNFSITASQALDLAQQVGDDVLFDFGTDGMLTVEDATISQLENDLVMV